MSHNLAHVQSMMQQLGPNCSEIDAIIQSEGASWAIQFADETVVVLEWSEEAPRLMFSAVLGRPADGRRLEVYQRLLRHNLEWRAAGGMRTAIGGPAGETLLLHEVQAVGLHEPQLRQMVLDFASQARSWSAYVGAEGAAAAPDLPPAGAALLA